MFRLAHELVLSVYRATANFPLEERFGLVSQMRRAAVSSVANIVEGSARRSERENLRFLECSFGSLRELGYFLDLSQDLRYLTPGQKKHLSTLQGRAIAALSALMQSRPLGRSTTS